MPYVLYADSKQAGPAKTNMRLSLISALLIGFSAVSALPVPTNDPTHPSNPGVDKKIVCVYRYCTAHAVNADRNFF